MKQEHILELFCIMDQNIRMVKISLISEQCKRLKSEKENSKIYS